MKSEKLLAIAGVAAVVVVFAIAILAQPLTCSERLYESEWRTCDDMFRVGFEKGSYFFADLWWYLGATPNLQTDAGRSMLSVAAQLGTERSVRYLLHRDADPEFRDKDGSEPLAWALRRGDAGIIGALREAKARKREAGQ